MQDFLAADQTAAIAIRTSPQLKKVLVYFSRKSPLKNECSYSTTSKEKDASNRMLKRNNSYARILKEEKSVTPVF